MNTDEHGLNARRVAHIALPLFWIAICACGHKSSGPHERQANLVAGTGAIHHPIATANQDAQKFFDQGLAMVYAFNFGEAIRSFQQAAEFDPNAAMPYWGIALAYGPNYYAWIVSRDHEQAGFDAIQTAAGSANAWLSFAEGKEAGKGYEVTATSVGDGDTFSIIKKGSGAVQRRCTHSGAAIASGCPNGTW